MIKPRIRPRQIAVFIAATFVAILAFVTILTACNRAFENPVDPQSSTFVGDSLLVDIDGNGIPDIIDEYAPGCRGLPCLDSARANYALGLGRHPRLFGLSADSLRIRIFDTARFNAQGKSLYPIRQFLWDFGKGIFADTTDSGVAVTAFRDTGWKIARVKAITQGQPAFVSRDTAWTIRVVQDVPKAVIHGDTLIRVGTPIVFRGEGKQEFGKIVNYKWSQGLVPAWSDSSADSNASFSYSQRGNYTVRLLVRDDIGNVDSTNHRITVVNDDPVASWTLKDTTIGHRDTLQFTLHASDPDSIRWVLWDWKADGIYEDTTQQGMIRRAFPPVSEVYFVRAMVCDRFDGKTFLFARVSVLADIPAAPTFIEPATQRWSTNSRPEWRWQSSVLWTGPDLYRFRLNDSSLAANSLNSSSPIFIPPNNLPEGKNTLCVQVRNQVGNVSPMACATYVIDTTPPQPPTLKAPASPTNQPNQVFSWKGGAGGMGFYRYRLDTAAWSGGSIDTAYVVNLTDGMHQLQVQVRDSAGNWSSSAVAHLQVDATPSAIPLVTISPAASPNRNPRPTWKWRTGGGGGMGVFRYKLVQGIVSIDWSVGVDTTSDSSFTPKTDLVDGIYWLHVQERDSLLNWSAAGYAILEIDATPPSVPVVTTSPASPTNVVRPTWLWQSGGGGNGMFRYKLNDSDMTTGATDTSARDFTPSTDLPDGRHTLYVRELDAVGNVSALGYASVHVEKDRMNQPTVSVSPASPTTNTRPTWSWSGNGTGTPNFRFRLDDTSMAAATVTTAKSFSPGWDLPEGKHTLYVQEQSPLGSWSFSGSKEVVIQGAGNQASPHAVWVAGYRSRNGGATWVSTNIGPAYNILHFVNSTTGWATYSSLIGIIYKTTDGGATWITQNTGAISGINSIFFIDVNTGWIVGNNGAIFKTNNGGASWIAQTSGTTASLYSVHFINTSNGWATGNSGTILSTSNGGATWIAQTSGTSANLRSLYFTSEYSGWVVGLSGVVLNTVNGGTTWNKVLSGLNRSLSNIHFVNSNLGWVVGDSGTILNTSNGGATWETQSSSTIQSLSDVHFVDANTGWAAGYSILLKTNNGGGTWQSQGTGNFVGLSSVSALPLNAPVPPAACVVRAPTDTTSLRPTWTWTSGGGGSGIYRYKLDDADLSTGATITSYNRFVPQTDLSEGLHTLYVQEMGEGTTWSPTASAIVNIDLTPPQAPVFASLSTPTNNPRPTWSWVGGGGGSGTYRYKFNDSNMTSGVTSSTVTSYSPSSNLTDGPHFLCVQERDAVGNWSAISIASTVVDRVAPGIPIISAPTSPTPNLRPTWSWVSGGGGNGVYRYKLNDSSMASGATETAELLYTPTTDLSDGVYTLNVQERDAAGNWSARGQATVTLDATPPNPPMVSSNPPSPTNISRPTFLWSTGGGGNGVFRYKLNDSDLTLGADTTTSLDFTPSSDLTDGDHVFYVQERDAVGYWSTTAKVVIQIFKLRLNPPSVSVNPTSPTGNTRPTWTWGGNPPIGSGTYRYKLNDTNWTSGATLTTSDNFTPTFDLAEGVHTLNVQERDTSGNWSYTGSRPITITHVLPSQHTVWVGLYGLPYGIIKSTDGGARWSSPTATGYPTFSVHFVDENVGWAVTGNSVVVKTSDGGATWVVQSTGTSQYLYSFDFIDASVGWAVGSNGTIVKTSNGGATWVVQSSGTSQYFYSVDFVDANVGWAVGNNGTIVKTSNGGATWVAQSSGTLESPYSVEFIDANVGLAVGDNGTILKTINGGATWVAQSSGTSQTLFSVEFIDANVGLAVGGNGTILKTINGGATWVPQSSGTSQTLFSVDFVDASVGWAVGSGGTILKTINGGATWVPQISGNTAEFRSVFVLPFNNLTPPSAPNLSAPSDTNSARPRWSWVSGGGGTGLYRYKLDDPDLSTGAIQTTYTHFTPNSDLIEGVHTLYVQEANESGLWSFSGSRSINVDLTPPFAPGVVARDSLTNDQTPGWIWWGGGFGTSVYRYKLDDSLLTIEADTTTSFSFTPATNLNEGLHTLYLQNMDAAGNWSPIVKASVTVDITPPNVPVITTPASPTNNTRPTWSWVSGGGGNGAYRLNVNDSDLAAAHFATTATNYSPIVSLADGLSTLYVQERDAAGNWSSISQSQPIVIDGTPPVSPSVTTSPPSPTNNPRPTFLWSTGGGGNGTFRYKLNDTDLTTNADTTTTNGFTPQVDLSDSSHNFYVQERDDVGNWSALGRVAIIISDVVTNAPVVTASLSPTIDATPTWTWASGGGGNGIYRYHLDNPDTSLASGAIETSGLTFTPSSNLSAGSHTLYVWEMNDVGFWSTEGTGAINILSHLITSVDTVGNVGAYSSLAIPPDGRPVISHTDYSNGDLKVTKCGNALCSSGNVSTTVDDVGEMPSIGLLSDGLPIIAYFDGTNRDLKVVKCGNSSCTAGNTITTVDSVGLIASWASPAIFVPPDNLPIISYFDETNQRLKVVKCGNNACSSGNSIVVASSSGNIGSFTSIFVPSDGLPVISCGAGAGLAVVKCGNELCSGSNTTTIMEPSGGYWTAIHVPSDGLPFITHQLFDGTFRTLKCGNELCSSGNAGSTLANSLGSDGPPLAISAGPDGYPIFGFRNSSGNLEVVKCGNASCSSGNVVSVIDSGSGGYNSIAIPSDGLPVISYLDQTKGDLKVVKCAKSDCSQLP